MGGHARRLARDLLLNTADLELPVARLILEDGDVCLKIGVAVCICGRVHRLWGFIVSHVYVPCEIKGLLTVS